MRVQVHQCRCVSGYISPLKTRSYSFISWIVHHDSVLTFFFLSVKSCVMAELYEMY